jgi:hypothetical protein
MEIKDVYTIEELGPELKKAEAVVYQMCKVVEACCGIKYSGRAKCNWCRKAIEMFFLCGSAQEDFVAYKKQVERANQRSRPPTKTKS